MRCSQCLAVVPAETQRCPKCGGTVFEAGGDNNPLRYVLPFFTTPVPFYVKAKPPIVVDGELIRFETEWKLYQVKLQQNAPSIFVWDRDGYLPGKQEAALHLVEAEDLAHILSSLPEKKVCELEGILRNEWGVQREEGQNLIEVLAGKPLFFQPVPKLKDPSILETMDWAAYIESLVCPKKGKDARLIVVHRAKLLKPLAMNYAPHSLEITNSNTGKTSFYEAAGIKIDKFTRKAILGFAKSPVEVYPGTIDGSELPTAFDQVESQDSYELARYMFNIMETGRALVDSGGVRFAVETKSCFAYLSNPVAKEAKVVEAFKALLNHISANPALGRRFGIILFGTNLKTIQGTEKMTLQERAEWKKAFTLFRAVEEYAIPKLKALIADSKLIEWLHKPIKGYREAIYNATKKLEDYNIASFFEAHAEAEHRVRGAALHAAVAFFLDKIALGKVTVERILEEAEDLLSEYVNINLQSIADLCNMWDVLRTDQAKAFFENLSGYMKEIVSAIIHHKRQNPDAVSVQLDAIPYIPEDQEAYRYFSRCVFKLKQRKRLDVLNESFRNFFGFQIERGNDVFTALYFETPQPPEDLKLLGKYGAFNHFTHFTVSLPLQTDRSAKEKKAQPKDKGEWTDFHAIGPMATPQRNYRKTVDGLLEYVKIERNPVISDADLAKLLDFYWTRESQDRVKQKLLDDGYLKPFTPGKFLIREDTYVQRRLNGETGEMVKKQCQQCAFWAGLKCNKHPDWVTVSPFQVACELFQARREA